MSRRVPHALLPRRPKRRLGALLVIVALICSSSPVAAEEATRVPARPSGLEVSTEAGSLDVGLDWDDVDGAAHYLVRWRRAGPGNPLNDGHEAQDSDTTVTVDDHGDWVVRIEACNDAGCGPPLAQRFAVEPGPNRAPAVDNEAERYESFTDDHTAPPGILVSKFFDGIFSDPDGDELAYTAEVTGGRAELASELEVRFNERARAGYQHILWFEADGDSDWSALSPPVANPAEFEVTLTATDPDGESASVTGVFSTRWEPPSFSAEYVPAPESESEPASVPETAAATERDEAADALAVAVVADPAALVEGDRVTLTAEISNPPAGSEPAYSWEMDDGGWFTAGRQAEFSYMSSTAGLWYFRVTVSYPGGESATSEPLPVAWATRAAPVARANAEGQGGPSGQGSGGAGQQPPTFSDPPDGRSSAQGQQRRFAEPETQPDREPLLGGIAMDDAADSVSGKENDHAQSFTTGKHRWGYALTAVSFDICFGVPRGYFTRTNYDPNCEERPADAPDDPTYEISLWTARRVPEIKTPADTGAAPGYYVPDTQIATFDKANDDPLARTPLVDTKYTTDHNSFTPSGGRVLLDPDTTYVVVFDFTPDRDNGLTADPLLLRNSGGYDPPDYGSGWYAETSLETDILPDGYSQQLAPWQRWNAHLTRPSSTQGAGGWQLGSFLQAERRSAFHHYRIQIDGYEYGPSTLSELGPDYAQVGRSAPGGCGGTPMPGLPLEDLMAGLHYYCHIPSGTWVLGRWPPPESSPNPYKSRAQQQQEQEEFWREQQRRFDEGVAERERLGIIDDGS